MLIGQRVNNRGWVCRPTKGSQFMRTAGSQLFWWTMSGLRWKHHELPTNHPRASAIRRWIRLRLGRPWVGCRASLFAPERLVQSGNLTLTCRRLLVPLQPTLSIAPTMLMHQQALDADINIALGCIFSNANRYPR